MMLASLLLPALATAALEASVAAQQPSAPSQGPPLDAQDQVEAVQVNASPRGKVEGEIAPELSLSAEDIKAYGAGNIAQLVEALEPQLRSGRGRADGPPVFLLNGRRVTGFQEISGIPGEAIEKVEILPEEVALTYGYRADQRVMNFILRKSFRAVTGEAEARIATAGGRTTHQIQSNYFKILDGSRYTLDFLFKGDDALFESERDIVRVAESSPYDLAGNIVGSPRGGEVDPALSALAGSIVTIAGVPDRFASGTFPALSDLVAGAGKARTDDLTASRSLQPRGRQAMIKGAITRDLNRTTSATLSASLDHARNLSFLGLPGVSLALPTGSPFSPFSRTVTLYRYLDAPGSLTRDVDALKGRVNLAMNGRIADWRWNFTSVYDRAESSTRTGRGLDTAAFRAAVSARDPSLNPFVDPPSAMMIPVSQDTADSVSTTASADLVARGDLFRLPAGGFSTTLRSTLDVRSLESESLRSGVSTQRDLSRRRGEMQGSFNLPVASRRREALSALGDLSLNLNGGYEDLSDFGGLITIGFGVNWTPVKPLSLVASFTEEDGAPSIQQLNDPVVSTANVSVFDFATGRTVNVTRVEGGNSGLKADSRRVMKLGANLRPFDKTDLTFTANYTRNEIDGSIAAFPTITPDLEAAMPERFTRDATGRLIAIDVRPVNFAGTDREELRWGINYSRALGQLPRAVARQGAGSGPTAFPMRAGRPGGGDRPSQGLLQFSVYHTWRIENRITVRQGLPALDLLNGAAVGRRGGQPRHEVQVQAGYFRNGLGARLNGNWRASTWVNGGVSGQDLFFSDLGTLNVSMFADLSNRRELIKRHAWARGARLSVNVDNLFDQKQQVQDALGITPQAYQSDYLDPVGRTVRLSVRKLFG